MYPKLNIDLKNLRGNALIIKKLCDDNGIYASFVTKVFHADSSCLKALEGITTEFASSRIKHLKNIKEILPEAKTLLIRIPMISELDDVVRYADCTLISEKTTLLALDKAAARESKVQNVIIMQDLGDLREGLMQRSDIISLAVFAKERCSNINVKGVGSNLTCYGSIRPTVKNMTELSETASELSAVLSRKELTVSGGATTSLELLINKNMPEGINHLRIGGLLCGPRYLKEFLPWNKHLNLKNVFSVQAEIIELNKKPTYPIGEIVVDGFGNKVTYEDNGTRARAIIALGKNDVGGLLQLYPTDEKIKIIGGSSDHTILDIEECEKAYKVGDILTFELDYESVMFAMQSEYFERRYLS